MCFGPGLCCDVLCANVCVFADMLIAIIGIRGGRFCGITLDAGPDDGMWFCGVTDCMLDRVGHDGIATRVASLYETERMSI